MKNRKIKQLESWDDIVNAVFYDGDVYAISVDTYNVIEAIYESVDTLLSWYHKDDTFFILVTEEDE